MAPEIAIVGGGPAGLSLAALLEKDGRDYIVFERSQEDFRPHGGCLDLHPGSGLRAIKEAGVFDEFKQNSRDGDATIHLVYDIHGNQPFSWGKGRDAPEVDRWRLRKVLLKAIPKEKVVWSKTLKEASRNDKGEVVLSFEDGTSASGFKLVVGADGSRSLIRQLVTPAKPVYAGHLYISTRISPGNLYFDAMVSLCRKGTMMVFGEGCHMVNSLQGDGFYRCDFGITAPADLPTNGTLDLANLEGVKQYLISNYFGHYAPKLLDIIRHCEGPVHPWIMHYVPPDKIEWKPTSGVTLIGDAAHVTTPYVGEGVNCAMRDTCILAEKLRELGVTQEAVTAYENEMFPYAIDVITRSLQSGKLFYAEDNPKGLIEMMSTSKPLIGGYDDI